MDKTSTIINKMDILAEHVPLRAPYGITFSIGNKCDFRCVYCRAHKKRRAEGARFTEMSLSDFKEIASQISEFDEPVRQVSFVSRGESLVYDDLPQMVSYLRQIRTVKQIKLVTNANKLTKGKSEALVHAGLDVLKISMQGVSSQRYAEYAKVNIDFDKFVEQVRYFYAISRGTCIVQVKIIDIAMKSDEERERFFDIFSGIADFVTIEQCIEEVGRGNAYGHDISHAEICPTPFYQMRIEHTGEVSPCCFAYYARDGENAIIGNAFKKSLKRIWEEDFRALQLMQLRQDISPQSICFCCKRFKSNEKVQNLLDGKAYDILHRY